MSKPVTIRFVGDESKFKATTEAVGGRLRGFAKEAEDSGRRAGEGFDRAAEGADNAEGKAQGFASTLTGTKDVMDAAGEIARGNLFDGLVLAGQGAADLAEGLNYTVIPAVKAAAQAFTRQALDAVRSRTANVAHAVASRAVTVATYAQAAAQRALNLALAANPIGIIITIIALVVAALVRWYMTSQRARDIINGVFKAVQRAAGELVAAAVSGFRFLLNIWLTVAGGILKGAATAFGWVPGVGPKLKRASDAFDSFKRKVLGVLEDVAGKARGWGNTTSANYAKGLLDGLAKAKASAAQVANVVRTHLRERSPAKEGPLSEGGGMRGWGQAAASHFAQGLREGAAGVRGGAAGLAGAAIPPLGGRGLALAGVGGGITIHARTNADAGEIAREVAWTLRTSGR